MPSDGLDHRLVAAGDVDPQRQLQHLQPRDPLQRHGEILGLVLQDDELRADGGELSGGRQVLALVLVGQLDLEEFRRFQPRAAGGRVLGGVAAVELDHLARPRTDDVDGFLVVAGVDRQGAEGGRGHLFGHAPAVAKLRFALSHEEAQAVLKTATERTRVFQTSGFSSSPLTAAAAAGVAGAAGGSAWILAEQPVSTAPASTTSAACLERDERTCRKQTRKTMMGPPLGTGCDGPLKPAAQARKESAFRRV